MEKKKNNFCILKITEEMSRIRIRIHESEVRIRIPTKMSQIPNAGLFIKLRNIRLCWHNLANTSKQKRNIASTICKLLNTFKEKMNFNCFCSDNHDIISVRTYELDTPEGVSKVKIFSVQCKKIEANFSYIWNLGLNIKYLENNHQTCLVNGESTS